jgi:hypothetical protein
VLTHFAYTRIFLLVVNADANKVLGILKLAGRCADGFERGKGSRYHAVNGYVALCGAKPGRRSAGWSSHAGVAVTCPKCLRKLEGGK